MSLPFNENIFQADHGFFAREPGPFEEDAVELSFWDNTTYVFGGANPIGPCGPGCSQSGADEWTDMGNTEPWQSVSHFSQGNDISAAHLWPKVYHESDSEWRVCMNEGGECGHVRDGGCGLRKLAMKPPRCQEMSNWCWATATRAITYYETGVEPSICDVVNIGRGSASCPNEAGWIWDIWTVLDEYEVERHSYHPPEFYPTFEDIKEWIDNGSPVLASIFYKRRETFHSVLIYGYDCSDGKEELFWYLINHCRGRNPDTHLAARERYSYEEFLDNREFKWYDTQPIGAP